MRLVSFALAALALAACQAPAPLDAPDVQGDPYTIVLSEFPAEPDLPPLLDGDTLQLRVSYLGDCEDHGFTLEEDARRDTTVLFLRHDARADDCTGTVYDELRLPLPEPLPPTGTVVLKNPEGGVPFLLRE